MNCEYHADFTIKMRLNRYIICTFVQIIEIMRRFSFISLSILTLAVISCINQDYDINNINMDELGGLEGIALPVGSTEKFYLADYLTEDVTDGLLKSDAQGDYYFTISGQASTDGFVIPDFRLDDFGNSDTQYIQSKIALAIPNIANNSDFVTDVVNFEDIVFSISIMQSDLPKEVIDISYADVESEIVVDFGFDSSHFPFQYIWIAKGARISLPEFIIPAQLPEGFTKIESNVIEISNDFPISANGSSIAFPIDALDFSALPEDQGIVYPGTISIDQEATISGGFYLRAADCLSGGTFSPKFEVNLTIGAMEVKSITAAVSIDESTLSVSQNLEVKDVPEFINNDDFYLDFNDLRLNLALDNDSPFSGSLKAEIATGSKSETFWTADIDGLSFSSYTESRFSLSENGTGAPEGYVDMAVPGLNSIMNRIPETISLRSALELSDEYLEIIPGSEYSFGLEYGFDVPMSFGENLSIVLSEDIVDMNVEIPSVSLSKAVVSLNFVNAIPLGLELQAVALDDMGQELPHINAEISQGVKAGTADSPVITPIEITLTCNGTLAFDGIRLGISLTSASEGAVLNSNQYIQITDISVHLPEGIAYSK